MATSAAAARSFFMGTCLFHSKRQQHVPRPSGDAAVARVHVEHAVDDGYSWTVHRRTFGLYAVDGEEFLVAVEAPDQRAVVGCVGAEPAVKRSREDDSRDGRERGALGRTASTSVAAQLR